MLANLVWPDKSRVTGSRPQKADGHMSAMSYLVRDQALGDSNPPPRLPTIQAFDSGNTPLYCSQRSAKARGDSPETTVSVLVGAGDFSSKLIGERNVRWPPDSFALGAC